MVEYVMELPAADLHSCHRRQKDMRFPLKQKSEIKCMEAFVCTVSFFDIETTTTEVMFPVGIQVVSVVRRVCIRASRA